MTTRHRTQKHPDASAPPSPPALKAPPPASDSGEVAALKAQIVKLKKTFKFHTGYDLDDDGNVKPINRKP